MQNVEKLEKVVKDGNCYGAQQMYKSISARFEQFLVVTFYQVYVMCFCSRKNEGVVPKDFRVSALKKEWNSYPRDYDLLL